MLRHSYAILIVAFSLLVNCKATNITSDKNGVHPYIVGGVEAAKHEFPWIVSLQMGRAFCGGSLIAPDVILTAAHCLVTEETCGVVSASSIKVTAGDHILFVNDETEQVIYGSRLRVHEKYNPERFDNDIALIKLQAKFNINLNVKPATRGSQSGYERGIVAGWGISSGGSQSSVLLKVDVPIVKGKDCDSQMRDKTGKFCAGSTNKDSCQGDSGGPFMCGKTVCGVVSYGQGCGVEGYPGVYTSVNTYKDWIDKNLNSFEDGTSYNCKSGSESITPYSSASLGRSIISLVAVAVSLYQILSV